MILPILISVSLAPVSYLFCATDSFVQNEVANASSAQTKILDLDDISSPLAGQLLWAGADIARREAEGSRDQRSCVSTITYVISRSSRPNTLAIVREEGFIPHRQPGAALHERDYPR